MRPQGFFSFAAQISLTLTAFFLASPVLFAANAGDSFEGTSPQEIASAAASLKWRKLLHYEKNGVLFTSQADGDGFFLSPEGRRNAVSELIATLKVFLENPPPTTPDQEPKICRFPARRRFLEKEFPELSPRFQKDPCPKFMAFKNSIQAVGASLVFSSYYLNNPSSAFGHTFMRLHRAGVAAPASDRAELLDMGVNYAAVAFTNNALLYGVYGMTGVFEGHFSKLPFYYKVREYSDFESRDLWTYELNLSQSEVDELVEHLWELGHTYFDYYFLSANCSYHLLGLLDVVKPDLKIVDQLSFYVIPSETIKVLARQPGLVKSIHFRPSNRKVYEASYRALSEREQGEFSKVTSAKDPAALTADLSDSSKMHVLDAALDYYDFRLAKDVLAEEKSASDLKQKFLLARAQIPLKTEKKDYPLPPQEVPHLGHDVKRFSLALGNSSRSHAFLDTRFRLAFHNKLDRLQGYPPFTTMEALDFHVRGESRIRKISLRDFSFVRIESYNPVDAYTFPPSFTFKVGAERVMEKNHCRGQRDCLVGIFRFGGGASFHLPWQMTSYVLGLSESSVGRGLEDGFFRLGIGPTLGIYRPFYSVWSAGAYYKILYYPWVRHHWVQSWGGELRLGLEKNWDLFVKTDHFELGREFSLGAQIFF